MGDFPIMTERGTFIINGTERVVVSQLVRSPGVYFSREMDKTSDKEIFIAKIIPSRGAWLEFDVDKKDTVGVRIDRKRRQLVTVLLKALGWTHRRDPDPVRQRPLDPEHPREGPRRDAGRGARGHLPQAPSGRAAHGREREDPAREPLLQPQALRRRQGRAPQGRQEARQGRGRAAEAAARPPQGARRARQPRQEGVGAVPLPRVQRPAEGRAGRRCAEVQGGAHLRGHAEDRRLPREAARRRGGLRPRRHRPLRQPPSAVGRRADPEPDPYRSVPDGAGGQGAHDHAGRRGDHAADPDQHPSGRGVDQGVLRHLAAVPVHGPDEHALGPDPQASSERPRPRRSLPRARRVRGARRAPVALRAHVPDRDAGGSEHRPDRVALELRAHQRVRVHRDPVPPRRGRQDHLEDRLPVGRRGGPARDRAGEHGLRLEDRQDRRRLGARAAARAARSTRCPPPRSTTWTSRRSSSCRWRPR